MLLILDTDHLSIVQQKSQPAFDCLRARLDQHPSADIATTIINFQEQVQGWLAYLNKKARKSAQILHGYAELEDRLQDFCRAKVLPFDHAAQDRFVELQKQKVRLATMDMRIACIALTTGATLLSCNLRDFRKVPGLTVEDWTR